MPTESKMFLLLNIETLQVVDDLNVSPFETVGFVELPWPGPLLPVGCTVRVAGWEAKVTYTDADSATGRIEIQCDFDEKDLDAMYMEGKRKAFFETLVREKWVSGP